MGISDLGNEIQNLNELKIIKGVEKIEMSMKRNRENEMKVEKWMNGNEKV